MVKDFGCISALGVFTSLFIFISGLHDDAKIIHGKSPLEIGFDEARNESIKHAKSDWILWLDADEEVIDNVNILKYLRPNIFQGYSIRQHHFTVDAGDTKIDTPIRLFRNGRTIRFYGFVHEHPEREGMMNDGVGASTLLGDVNIAHDGYFSESRRRGRFHRNIDLMFKDSSLDPPTHKYSILGFIFFNS